MKQIYTTWFYLLCVHARGEGAARVQAHEKINNLKINLATMETEKYYRETRSSKLMEKWLHSGIRQLQMQSQPKIQEVSSRNESAEPQQANTTI